MMTPVAKNTSNFNNMLDRIKESGTFLQIKI